MADYDNAEVTERERLAAQNQIALAKYNADTSRNQLAQQLANYDMSDQQNRRLADVQRTQNSRKTEADRFDAMRDLQNSSLGLFGSMNQAMNSSSLGNAMYMLNNRNDKDNMNYWTQHQVNQNAVENAYDESVNQNNLARNEAATTTEAAIRNMEADLAANLNNINPKLYQAPGTGDANLGSGSGNTPRSGNASGTTDSTEENTNPDGVGIYDANKVDANRARLSGYLMPNYTGYTPENSARNTAQRNKLQQNNYFSRLLNGFNRR